MEVTTGCENASSNDSTSAIEAERRQYESARVRDSPPAERGTERDRDAPSVERHPLITLNGRDSAPPGQGGDIPSVGRHQAVGDRPVPERHGVLRGRRDNAMDSYRDHLKSESMRGGYERAWQALSDYGKDTSPTSMYEGAPHPVPGYERLSVDRAHTMKEFEKQITELKKENFNLKLRIYFLEEQMQRQCDTSSDELHRMNIELKVEVESLKHDFQEKHNLLVRASKAMESLASEHDLALQRLREQHIKYLQDMEDAQSHELHQLQTEIQHEKAELEKICVLLDQERVQRFTAEERLVAVNDQYTKSMAILEERDWIIQCLNETVHSKDALIAQLEKQIASMMPYEASGDKSGRNAGLLFRESDDRDLLEPSRTICNVDGAHGKEENVNEWQKKIKEMDNLISELQQKLEANKAGSATEEKNSLKREKAIQGLTLALKKKNKENDKLLNEIDNLNAALSKGRESAQLQTLKENIHPDYKKLIFTLQAEQDVYNRLLKYERESGNLKKELESIAMLRKWLEENIQANQELRKIMEAQIMAKCKGDDTMSFLGDQTSYLSICLDHLDQNEYFFAGCPQKTTESKNNMHIAESGEVLRGEVGTQTQRDISVLAGENLKYQPDYKSDLSFNERSIIKGEDGGNDSKPTRNKQNTVSSCTQTEPMAFSNKCMPVIESRLPKESAELLWTLQDEEFNILSQCLPEMTSNTCKIQGYKQGKVYKFRQNAKKSRLPVLLKSSLNVKLKTDAISTPSKENDHSCPEELQMENSRFNVQIRCAEVEAESLEENKDLVGENGVPDQNNPDHEQRDLTNQDVHTELKNHRFSEESKQAESEIATLKANKELLKCKEADLHHSKLRESTEEALKELQVKNYQLSEQLKQAQIEIETLKTSEELLRCKACEHDLFNLKDEEKKSAEQALQKELQAENYQLFEQLKQAQMEIETLKTSEELLRFKACELDLCTLKDEQRTSAERALQKELQAENYSLSEQLKQAQMKIESLKANEELIKCENIVPDLSDSTKEQRESIDQILQAENDRLSGQLVHAKIEIETLKASGELLRRKTSENDSKEELRKSKDQVLQNELQGEIYRLSEQLKQAQMEIETLKSNEELIKHKDTVLGLSDSLKDEIQATDQSLQKELQGENYGLSEHLKQTQMEIEPLIANATLITHNSIVLEISSSNKVQAESTNQASQKELQAENVRLSEQLKLAQMEIEKLQAERRSTGSSNDSLKLHGSDADDDLSEQSFLEKTVTNSVNVNEVDATSDFGDEVCGPHINSQNAAALRCHHDNHCMECANNRGIISLPTSNSKRPSTLHTSSKFTKVSSHRSFEDTTSLSKYDLLVQSQARELSLQRQKIKESHNLSVICSKNFFNILKAFENLLPSGALDSNITLGFREQITQTVEWLKELEYKLSDAFYGEEDAYSDHSVDSLLYTPSRLVPGHRMWADKHGCHVLGLVEDYNALRKQILEARNVLQEMEALIDHGVQTAVLNMTEHFGNIFFEKLTRTKQSLEEAGCLLKLLWRVSLPLQIHSPYNINQEEEANREVNRLRKRVLEQEKLLSGMVKRVYSENQMKEDIEKLILDQLAITHDILKKAKGNLEVQVVDKLH